MRTFLKQMLFLSFMVILCRCEKEPTVPRIDTTPVSGITPNSTISGGHIISNGGAEITSKGVCWSTIPNPTISDNYIQGIESNSFMCVITDLSPSTAYWIRAYATNSAGTGYGNAYLFKTWAGSVTDIDGNIYNTIAIGSQTWMGENLKVTRLNDRTEIQLVTDIHVWRDLTIPSYCYYKFFRWYGYCCGKA